MTTINWYEFDENKKSDLASLNFISNIKEKKDFINSIPNCAVIDDMPCKRVVKRLTDEQINAINAYINKYGVDPVEAMHILFG